ncbi:MAG: carbon-nitrogen hydrolase family protein [Bauldia litoralis]
MTDRCFRVAGVQSAPIFLDLAATVDKAIGLIEEAAKADARLIAFPEVWLPGYPWWIWLGSPAWGLQFMKRYHLNAMSRDGREMRALCDAARRHKIFVALGYAERGGGSLYMAQSLIDDRGKPVFHRRKLKPARTERSVFGEGDGSHLCVAETDIGRVGALCCGEHFQPLSKYAMYSQQQEIHAAAWPGFSLLRGKAFLNGPQAALVATQMYAIEGQCFAIAATTVNDEAMLSVVCDTPERRAMLTVDGKAAAGGATMIFGPDGRPLTDPLPEDEEGIVYADIDLETLFLAKTAADATGHYARPDVLRLLFDRRPAPNVMGFDAAMDVADLAEPAWTGHEG